MIKNVWVIGSGGSARDTFSWTLHDMRQRGERFRMAGFLADVAVDEYPVLELMGERWRDCLFLSLAEYTPVPGDVFVCGIGGSKLRQRVITPLLDRGFEFLTVIHPSAVVGENVRIGMGTVICPQCSCSPNADIGAFGLLNVAAVVGHDIVVGDFSTIGPDACALGRVWLGERVEIGSGAKILPDMHVGDDAVVGAGAVVNKDVEPGLTVVGIPARPVKRNSA